MDEGRHNDPKFEHFELLDNLDISGYIQIYLDIFGYIWIIWIYLDISGYIWIYLDISGYILVPLANSDWAGGAISFLAAFPCF